ncbi:MAG: FGGY family carbohydrate kinase, partial [Verrucomicrobiia bacterium]
MARLFLGLDSSTQSLSAIVIDHDTRKVVYETSLNFDKTFPHYQTHSGTLRAPRTPSGQADPLVVHSPPLMWAEALDLMFVQMKNDGVALGDILAVSGSGQQHGSVYLNDRVADALANLNPAKSLVENLSGTFARATSPIWMDSSTSVECAEIRKKLGGIKATAQLTGSDTFERFTGPQIRKFYKTEPEKFAKTASIALVSSFMASILAGRIAPIDHGDGAGMNLMDIRKKTWHPDALKATAPHLKQKLPPLAESSRIIGSVGPYFVKKYGLNPDAQALVWSGDNPCSVIGLGLIKEGMVAISLGTSDTYFGSMKRCRVDERGEGHVFGSPAGNYMTLICFKNGSLARERIRDQYGLDWNGFNNALAGTPPGNNGGILLPWFEAEIVPGETVKLRHTALLRSSFPVRWLKVRYPSLGREAGTAMDLSPNQAASQEATQTLPASTPLSQPYWLREEHPIGMYKVADPALIGRPENPPALPVEYVLEVGGQTLTIPDEPIAIEKIAAQTDTRRHLEVIAPVSLKLNSDVQLFTPGQTHPVAVEIVARRAGSNGELQLEAPAGWRVAPATQAFRLTKAGDTARFTFTVTAPVQPATARLIACAQIGG